MKPTRFTRDERASLSHALMHLEENKITEPGHHGWYCGRKDQFIKRHNKAKELIRSLLKQQPETL